MTAKVLDDNKPIESLKSKKSIRTVSNFTDLIQFQLIWQSLVNFLWSRFYRYPRLEKEGDNFCFVCTYSKHWAHEIRKFNYVVAIVVQRRQRNVQKSVMLVQSCCLLI